MHQLWQAAAEAAEGGEGCEEGVIVEASPQTVTMWHYNGLPPAGPRMAKLGVEYTRLHTAAAKTFKENYFKPLTGEIDDVIQADGQDKAAR